MDFLNQAFGIIPKELDGYESTLDSPAFDILQGLNAKYFLEYVSRKEFYLFQGTIANGSRRAKRIHSDTFFNMPIVLPSIEEQEKIGKFFDTLDHTIALHQDAIQHQQDLKKAMLQKLFPVNGARIPTVRFATFEEEWEQRKLSKVFNILDGDRGKNYPGEKDFLEKGNTLFLDTGNVKKNGFEFKTTKYISKEKDDSLRSGKLELYDFVLTSRGTLGNVAYYNESVHNKYSSIRINSAMLILRPLKRNEVSDSYMEAVLRGNILDMFMKKNHVGSAQPHITKRDFSSLKVNIPNTFEEQQKIGAFFQSLDDTIALHQQALDELKLLKQRLLQKMFV